MTNVEAIIRALAFLAFFRIALRLFPGVSAPAPLSMRVVTSLEVAFGVGVILPGVTFILFFPREVGLRSSLVLTLVVLIGLAWIGLIVRLLNYKAWGKEVCLVLFLGRIVALVAMPFSTGNLALFIVRAIAMIGIPISLVNACILWRSTTAKFLYRERGSGTTRVGPGYVVDR